MELRPPAISCNAPRAAQCERKNNSPLGLLSRDASYRMPPPAVAMNCSSVIRIAMYNVNTPPASVCILRLSAIGDVCHVLPVVRTLQRAWPDTRFTWIIGRVEAKLLGHIPDIEFIVLDKGSLLKSYRTLRAAMRGRRFDVLMHMQLALRASILSTLVPASIKLGYDRRRARELQWLFTSGRIRPAERQ